MKILTTLIFLILSFHLFAADYQGEFNLTDSAQQVKEGDIVEGVIRVWPLENADLNEFKGLEEQVLFNVFYLSEIESVALSENNADVVEIKGSFIVKGNVNPHEQIINYKGNAIRIPAPHVQVERLEDNAKDFYVMDQSLNYSRASLYIFIAVLLAILLFIAAKRKAILNYIKKFKNDPKTILIRKYRDLFTKASSREEYEAIYAFRKEWLSLIENQTSAHLNFFNVMEKHQYKPAWTPMDLNEVKSSFDSIRGSFK